VTARVVAGGLVKNFDTGEQVRTNEYSSDEEGKTALRCEAHYITYS
jgi:hypothetical protein